jgi:hypothetical protein
MSSEVNPPSSEIQGQSCQNCPAMRDETLELYNLMEQKARLKAYAYDVMGPHYEYGAAGDYRAYPEELVQAWRAEVALQLESVDTRIEDTRALMNSLASDCIEPVEATVERSGVSCVVKLCMARRQQQ